MIIYHLEKVSFSFKDNAISVYCRTDTTHLFMKTVPKPLSVCIYIYKYPTWKLRWFNTYSETGYLTYKQTNPGHHHPNARPAYLL